MIRKKIFTQRFKKTSLVFIFAALLVFPFQNCKKFESNEGLVDESSTANSTSGLPPDSTTTTTTEPDPAVLAAEKARQDRCRNNIKTPLIVNASTINNSEFFLKSGLSNTAGDVNAAENRDITVDPSKGIIDPNLTTPQLNGGDGCVYSTSLRVESVNDAGHLAVLNSAIDFSGNNVVTADQATNFNLIKTSVAISPNNNNNTFATDTLNFKMSVTNNNNRTLRCVDGSFWYAVRVRVATQALQPNRQLDSAPVYFKANLANSCWYEQKLKASTDYPLNAKAGSKVALSGNWAAVLAQADSNRGAVYMFNKDGNGNWNFSQKLLMSDGANGHNLSNLDLNDNILAVSNASYGTKGKVYIFKNAGGVWTEAQQIPAHESTVLYQQFGLGLSLGASTLAIGAPSHPKSGAVDSDTGKVYIYNLNSTSGQFDYAQTIEGMNEAHYGFGKTLLLSGSKLFVGAPESVNDSSGRVFVFNNATSWTQELIISPPAGITGSAGFGSAIAFNGAALAIGAPLNNRDTNNPDSGTVYYYKTYNGGLFHTMNGPGANVKFGSSLVFNSTSLFVGCTGCGTNLSGVVYRKLISNIESATATNRDLNAFIQFSHDNTNTESFGQSIDSDGGTSLIVGAPSKDVPNLKSGAAYLYTVR